MKEKKAERWAQMIRIATVPPVMVTVLLMLLYGAGRITGREAGWGFLCLAAVPVCAYPTVWAIPALRRKRRENERRLAFMFTGAGYAAGLIGGYVWGVGSVLRTVLWAYALSLVFLAGCNGLWHKKASGHACCVTGPVLLAAQILGGDRWWLWMLCGSVLVAAVWAASRRLRRHTPAELTFGTLCALLGFLLS